MSLITFIKNIIAILFFFYLLANVFTPPSMFLLLLSLLVESLGPDLKPCSTAGY